MTWAKFGTEFRGQIRMAGLSDAAFRTHTEALMWLHEVESPGTRIPRYLIPAFAGSAAAMPAITELLDAGF